MHAEARLLGSPLDAVDRAVQALVQTQRADGCWKSTPDMGPLGLAITVLTEAWLRALSPEDAKRTIATLGRAQLADGGFEVHPGAGVASLGATAVCRAALKACGARHDSPIVKRADACITALGGLERVRERLLSHGEPAALFCVMVGLLPPDCLPPLSPDMAALPWSERMLDGRLHGGVPMVIYACAAVRERFATQRLMPGILRAPVRALARARLTQYIGQFQNPNGSWNCAVYCTVFNLIALEGVGLTASDPMIHRGLAWLDSRKTREQDGIAISIFDGEVWETAFGILALIGAGVRRDDPAITHAVEYLERVQCTRVQPRLNQPDPRAPRTGGWAFQAGNETMPDCDDSGLAVGAIAAASRAVPRPSLEAGIAWLRGMQNAGGGFGSYVHGLPDKPPGQPLFVSRRPALTDLRAVIDTVTNPPPEFGDAAIADVVGRVLWGFGEAGLRASDPAVARAIAFLQRDQCPNGAWWGIWNPAYVAGTAFAVIGLAAVGVDLEETWIARAVAWLIAAQNEDGGFGEQPGSFLDPALAGAGPSHPSLTGIVLRAFSGVIAAGSGGDRLRASADRAARYLEATQLDDGGWRSDGYLFTIIPPTFYAWGHHRLYYPLLGLGHWREVASRPLPARPS